MCAVVKFVVGQGKRCGRRKAGAQSCFLGGHLLEALLAKPLLYIGKSIGKICLQSPVGLPKPYDQWIRCPSSRYLSAKQTDQVDRLTHQSVPALRLPTTLKHRSLLEGLCSLPEVIRSYLSNHQLLLPSMPELSLDPRLGQTAMQLRRGHEKLGKAWRQQHSTRFAGIVSGPEAQHR